MRNSKKRKREEGQGKEGRIRNWEEGKAREEEGRRGKRGKGRRKEVEEWEVQRGIGEKQEGSNK